MIPWYESRMLAARARVPCTCMLWQVVPSTSTRKSINLDLARAARYWYFTKNRPAHADQNSDQPILLLAVNLPAVRVGHGVGPGWERSRRAGPLAADRHHTRTHRHVTHTLTSHNQFLQVYSYTTRSILERDRMVRICTQKLLDVNCLISFAPPRRATWRKLSLGR